MQNSLISLEERIIATLSNPNSYLWYPDLTCDLAKTGWERLEDKYNINEADYGTARVILNNPNQDVEIAFHQTVQLDNQNILIPIEILPNLIISEYRKSGVNFYTKDYLVLEKPEIMECLNDAFEKIKQVPSLFKTVTLLVKSIHLIRTDSDDYDVSFSEPHIPFSIFTSIPKTHNEINALRVAEAIIHEAMHLQLTLIEKIVPLINSNEEKIYSPWKQEYRTPQGVLHALYVFQIINVFLFFLGNKVSKKQISFIQNRRSKIYEEIHQIQSFIHSSALSFIGEKIVKNLLLFRPTFDK